MVEKPHVPIPTTHELLLKVSAAVGELTDRVAKVETRAALAHGRLNLHRIALDPVPDFMQRRIQTPPLDTKPGRFTSVEVGNETIPIIYICRVCGNTVPRADGKLFPCSWPGVKPGKDKNVFVCHPCVDDCS
jgi:hypothetical protein